MYEKLMRVLAKTVGSVWLIIGIYGLVAAARVEHDRLTLLALGVFFGGAGFWLIVARNPLGTLGGKRE